MFKNLFKKENWGLIALMIIPAIKEAIEHLLDMLKDKTPSYVDKIVDLTNKTFISNLITIKTDNIDDDAGQVKEMWQRERKNYIVGVLDAAAEGLQEIIKDKDLINYENVELVVNDQITALRASLQKIKDLESGLITTEQRQVILEEFALKKNNSQNLV